MFCVVFGVDGGGGGDVVVVNFQLAVYGWMVQGGIVSPPFRANVRKTKTKNFEVNIQDRTYIGKVLWNKTLNSPIARGVEICFGFSLKISPTRA